VRDTLSQIRQAIEQLAKKRDQSKYRFAKVVAKAMQTAYGQDREQTQRLLSQAKFTRPLAQKATEIAAQSGGFSIWSMVNALTQLSRQTQFAGSRAELDQKASALLNLVAA
jgi:translation initiation factor 2B subunit (eIF-2B alpha/beta/delta family)